MGHGDYDCGQQPRGGTMPSEADISEAVGQGGFVTDRARRARHWEARRLPALLVPVCLICLECALGGTSLFLLAWLPDADALLNGAGPLFLILTLIGLARRGLYRPGPGPAVRGQIARSAAAIAGALGTTMLAMLLLSGGPGELGPVAARLTLAGLLILFGRTFAATILHRGLGARLAARAVVIGEGGSAADLLAVARATPGFPRLVGRLDDNTAAPAVPGLPCLGPVARLEGMVKAGQVDQVILTLPGEQDHRTWSMVRQLASLPVDIRVCPNRPIEYGADGLIHVLDRPIGDWAGLIKRIEDIVLGALLLAAFALPMLLVALAVRLDSPGPVLFRQRRIGLNNGLFEMLKFRTMRQDAAPTTTLSQATRDDPRVTRLGAFLRRSSLDELPQLFNVLRGEMALVGPRPHAPGTTANGRAFEEIVPFYAARHRVKPGITGLAQVRGLRGETRTEDAVRARVDADFEYIQRWSPGVDLLILLRTAICVLTMRNAY